MSVRGRRPQFPLTKAALLLRISERGVALVEVLVAASIVLVVVALVSSTLTQYTETRDVYYHTTRKAYLAEEGYELVRLLRDGSWSIITMLTTGNVYYLQLATSSVSVAGIPEVIDGRYTRSIVLRPLYRNSSTGDIVSSTSAAAVVDPQGRELEVRVADTLGTTTMRAILINLSGV